MSAVETDVRDMQQRSQRFVWGGRIFVAVIALEAVYLLYHALAFAPALLALQLATDNIRITGGIGAYRHAWRDEAPALWPKMLADNSPGLEQWVGIIFVFLLVTALYYLFLRHPRGEPVDFDQRCIPAERRDELLSALDRDGAHLDLYLLRRDRSAACRIGNRLYIGSALLEDLLYKSEGHAREKLAFIVEHEGVHHVAGDNFVYSFGRTIILIITIISSPFLANALFIAVTASVPTTILYDSSDWIRNALVCLLSLLLLSLIAPLAIGSISAFALIREFFADRIAAIRFPDGNPYAYAPDAIFGGRLFASWRLSPPRHARLDHIAGHSGFVGAFAALAISLWIVLRTTVLVVDPQGSAGWFWIFDLGVVLALGLALSACPAPVRGRSSYGLVPWSGLVSLIIVIAVLAAGLRSFGFNELGLALVSVGRMTALLLPPAAVSAVTAGFLALRPIREPVIPLVGPSAQTGFAFFGLFLISSPAYFFSHAFAAYALYVTGRLSGQLVSVALGLRSGDTIFILDLIAAVVALPILALVVFNMTRIRLWSMWIETGLAWLVSALAIGLTATLLAINRQPNGSFDLQSVEQVMMSDIPLYLVAPIMAASLLCIVIAASFYARVKMARASAR